MAAQLTGTLSNFMIRTRRYLKEETASKSHWSDDFLKQLFNTAYRLRFSQLHVTHEGYGTIIATRDVVAEQERYSWPTGFQRLLKMEVVRTDGRTVPLQRNERHYHTKQTANTSGDSWLPFYRPIGNGFVLEPASVTSLTGGIRMEYVGVPVELTADGDSLDSDFPELFDELLVVDTVISAYDQESIQETGRMQSLLRRRAEWEAAFERYIDGRIEASDYVTPFVAHYTDS